MTILQNSDWFMTSRAGNHTKSTLGTLLGFIEANLGTNTHQVADITARDAIAVDELSIGDRVKVDDATADASVNTGWAIYIYAGPGLWTKVAEEESMDVVINPTNLEYIASATGGTVNNSNGTGFSIPVADAIDQAGLLVPLDKSKLDNITVTAAVDLDALAADTHKPATTAGSTATNPIAIGGTTGQELSFNIGALTELT